jgi:hypothetical protein
MELMRKCIDKHTLHTREKSMYAGCWKLHYRLSHVKLSTLRSGNREIDSIVSADRIAFCSGKGGSFTLNSREHTK